MMREKIWTEENVKAALEAFPTSNPDALDEYDKRDENLVNDDTLIVGQLTILEHTRYNQAYVRVMERERMHTGLRWAFWQCTGEVPPQSASTTELRAMLQHNRFKQWKAKGSYVPIEDYNRLQDEQDKLVEEFKKRVDEFAAARLDNANLQGQVKSLLQVVLNDRAKQRNDAAEAKNK